MLNTLQKGNAQVVVVAIAVVAMLLFERRRGWARERSSPMPP